MDLKFNRFEVGKVLIIAPKKVAEATWTDEIAKWDHLSLLKTSLVLGGLQKRLKSNAKTSDIYVKNR